jgi:hypothetical protein
LIVAARSRRSSDVESKNKSRPGDKASIPAEAALSFLKDTKGTLIWSARDLADALKISRRDAEQVIPFLEAQGYVQRAKAKEQWMTTPAGESVSGAKAPRFTRESVEQAVAALKDRIESANEDRESPFRITDAVAFGDFLLNDRPRVRAADVGIGLAKRGEPAAELHSANDAKAERAFLRQLRGRTAVLNVKPHQPWMHKRSHLDLL